jgi:PAS domain S-box-containing protein
MNSSAPNVPLDIGEDLAHARAVVWRTAGPQPADADSTFRDLTDSAPVMLYLLDADGRPTFLNKPLLDFHGVEAAELRHASPELPLHPDDRDRVRAGFADALQRREPFTTEFRMRRSDGAYRWFLNQAVPRFEGSGNFIGYVGSCHDITDRKAAEEALRQSEQRYRDVVESQTEMVCRYLPDTTLTFVNEAYCRFFGRSREELIGRRFLDFIPEAAREAALAPIGQLLTEPGVVRVNEHEVIRADGTVGWHQWEDRALVGDDGSVGEFQAIGQDITARKAAESALRRNEEALRASYARVQELAGKLIQAQEAERSRIARELHDNVGQQLAAVSIGLSDVRRRAAGSPEVQEEIASLQARAGELGEDIRQLSHQLHPSALRHAGLVAALRGYCAEARARFGFDLDFVAGDGVDELPSDLSLSLYRIVQEALGNAGRHAGARHVRVTVRRRGAGLELIVVDDGRGFDLAASRRSEGLGLVSMDERARLAGGAMTVDTAAGRGTKVTVWVPVEAALHAADDATDRR